jgi:hypothetical protein
MPISTSPSRARPLFQLESAETSTDRAWLRESDAGSATRCQRRLLPYSSTRTGNTLLLRFSAEIRVHKGRIVRDGLVLDIEPGKNTDELRLTHRKSVHSTPFPALRGSSSPGQGPPPCTMEYHYLYDPTANRTGRAVSARTSRKKEGRGSPHQGNQGARRPTRTAGGHGGARGK